MHGMNIKLNLPMYSLKYFKLYIFHMMLIPYNSPLKAKSYIKYIK
jgi:hypothetical protein